MGTRNRERLNDDTATPRRLLIVDLKNVVYRAVSMNGALFSGRTFTGGLYGFVASTLAAAREVQATRVVVATDTPPYVRHAQFAGYKGNRKKPGEDAEKDMLVMKAAQSTAQVAQLCELLGIPLWSSKGYEYDDLCAWYVRKHHTRFDLIAAMTNDSDLYQLFDVPGFVVYRGAKRGVYGRAEFVKEYGDITREQWVQVLAMTGTHNAIPGIAGVGPKTALAALRDAALMRGIMSKHAEIVERNRALIELPHASLPDDPGHRVQRHTIGIRQFDAFCARYAIRPTGPMLETLADLGRANEK